MNAKEYVDSLFKGYEENPALADFKEELLANLNAKIESLVKKGMDKAAAVEKASAELGDISMLADELSLKKRKEVFEEVYMDIKQYIPAKRVIAYVVFGVTALFGIIVALITFFAAKSTGLTGVAQIGENGTVFFASMMPFITAAIIGFTYLGITQETASMYPVSKKRGAWYAGASGLISFGIFTMPIVYFSTRYADTLTVHGIPVENFEALVPVISVMIPFILPSIGILVFLAMTEKDRLKPWAKEFRNKAVMREMEMWNDPVTATRFGMFSGAIWIFAAGLFILLGFVISFKFSWLVFVFAVAFQLLVQGLMSRKNA
jgi:hypothetical protein